MLKHLQAVYPEEGCGLLASVDGIICRHFPIENILHSATAYQMHPQQQIAAFCEIEKVGELAGIYHSHPHSPALPSQTDITQSTYPNIPMLIFSFAQQPPALAAFYLDPKTITACPVPIQILEDDSPLLAKVIPIVL